MATKVKFAEEAIIPVVKQCVHCGSTCKEDITWREYTGPFNQQPFSPKNTARIMDRLMINPDVVAYCPTCNKFSIVFERKYFKKGKRKFLKPWPSFVLAIVNGLAVFVAGAAISYFFSHSISQQFGLGLICISPLVLIAKWYDSRWITQRVSTISDRAVDEILVAEYKHFSSLSFNNPNGRIPQRDNKFCSGWEKRQRKLLKSMDR
ncbi:hypothetical protein [uncultured Rubinisphaera sp.]|uniref:hypothetical protein n=1 Tax=uncultured Rubinisphaera sp. TaxID=1678686 RepID=UPI0030DD0F17|tara:strand:- start:245 stop:862 length:618 start_codon:yes stop_codon:yes gene_type:complete